MAKYRLHELESASDWLASGTKIIDLDFAKPMTQIQIFGVFTAATTTWAASPAANFLKIEITDGSTVLWGATGKALQGHYMRSTGKSPHGYQYLRNTKGVGVALNINFGRMFGDKKYAFDPSKYKNPQLKITYDENVHNTSTSVNSIYVQAVLFDDDAPTPVGFLRLYEVEAYTSSANAWKTIDLPTDKICRTLYFHAQVSQTALATTIDQLKLTEDGDERVPYEDYAYKIFRQLNYTSPLFTEHFRIMVTTSGDTYFSAIGDIIGGSTGSYDGARASGMASHQGGSFKMRVETGSEQYTAVIEGYNPQAMYRLDLCDYDDDAQWFNPQRLGTWQLKLKAGSAATGTFYVYVEQVMRY